MIERSEELRGVDQEVVRPTAASLVNSKHRRRASKLSDPLRAVLSYTYVPSTRSVPAFVIEVLTCGHVTLRDTWARKAKQRRCHVCGDAA